jgi:hypothetical protein
MTAISKIKIINNIVRFTMAGLLVLAEAGCGNRSVPQAESPAAVTFKPQEMADALHTVIAADQERCFQPGRELSLMAAHAVELREASQSVQQQGAEFHYVLRSLWPINPKSAPETETEKTGLRFVAGDPESNYYAEESLGGRRYFTAVYAVAATGGACADCHNRDVRSPKKDFKAGDVMGGLIVRVPLEF